MPVHELRDTDEAMRFIAQGLWLQRVLPPQPERVAFILQCVSELSGSGEPMTPIGFVADVAHVVFEPLAGARQDAAEVPGWPPGLARAYDDYALGKLYADGSFERGAAALRQYRDHDRVLGLAFMLKQMRERAGLGGVLLSPAVLKALRERPADELLGRGWDALVQSGPMPLLINLYEELVTALHNTGELLRAEDIFELEHRTAVSAFSQRLALRQVLQAAGVLEAELPAQRPRLPPRRQEVPTRLLEEDIYPVGGFSSLSTRGSIESLLHSQLAFMEDDRPDLFDIKFLRDELLYYARDENQFLRRRRTFVFALHPDLAQARFKDRDLPWQRLILLLGLVVAATRRLIDWLSTEALAFDFLLIHDGPDASPLTNEAAILEMIFREQIANGTVRISPCPQAELPTHCTQRSRRSACHVLSLSTTDRPVQADAVQVARLVMAGPCPSVASAGEPVERTEVEEPLAGWTTALAELLNQWV